MQDIFPRLGSKQMWDVKNPRVMDTVTPHRFTDSPLEAFGTFWSRSQPSWRSAAGRCDIQRWNSGISEKNAVYMLEIITTVYLVNLVYYGYRLSMNTYTIVPRDDMYIYMKLCIIYNMYIQIHWIHLILYIYIYYILSILSFLSICNLIEQSTLIDEVVGGKRGWLTLGNGLTTDNWDKEAAMKRLNSVRFKAQMMAGNVMKTCI